MTLDLLSEREDSIRHQISIIEGLIRTVALPAETEEGESASKAKAALAKHRKDLAAAQARLADVQAARQGAIDKQTERDVELANLEIGERRRRVNAGLAQLQGVAKRLDAQVQQVVSTLEEATGIRNDVLGLAESKLLRDQMFDAWGSLPAVVGYHLRDHGFQSTAFPDKLVNGWAALLPAPEQTERKEG
ncbi:hypothetical protein [Rhodospirillaceae bacterium SYSU D60014]|uniref:hypothetical protein n=1 Tax=Virgifigura deserti TaxID=2268457 RepID=UPI000E6737CD